MYSKNLRNSNSSIRDKNKYAREFKDYVPPPKTKTPPVAKITYTKTEKYTAKPTT